MGEPSPPTDSTTLMRSPPLNTNSWDISPLTENPTVPSPSTNTDLPNSPRELRSTRDGTPLKDKPPSKVSTTSPTEPMTKSRCSTVSSKCHPPSPRRTTLPSMPPPPPQSTGEPRVVSPQLRIKDNAVHAGLSPPPVPWKVLISLPLETLSPSPSLTSLIAHG